MQLKFGGLGWNRVSPPHELLNINGYIQCSILQNYISRNNRIKKVGGTAAYNTSALVNPITWAKRSYHLRGDGTFAKYTFCFSNGIIYSGDDVNGTLIPRQIGFTHASYPADMTYQVAGNSILFFFTGKDIPYKFDGNGSFAWEKTTLDNDITMGVVHLDRGFYIHANNSNLDYSIATTNPESIQDTILVGNDKDSTNRAIVLGGDESFYIFKNNAIYQLYGRTASTFQVRLVTNKYGLANKRAIYPVGSGFIFLNEHDKELYFFGGTEASIKPLTEQDIRLREIIDLTDDSINSTVMTVHQGLFRFAFQHTESAIDSNNCELVYPVNEPMPNGLPKWSLIKGDNVSCYASLNQQGDRNDLLTGRSDVGKLMYHNRGWNFDGVAEETQVRTAEIILSDEFVMRMNDFYIKAHPGSVSNPSTFRYFVNGRFSDRGEVSQSMQGETRQVGQIYIQKSYMFNDGVTPLSISARGNSIAFEIYDNNLSNEMEIYSIAFTYKKRYRIRNQLV